MHLVTGDVSSSPRWKQDHRKSDPEENDHERAEIQGRQRLDTILENTYCRRGEDRRSVVVGYNFCTNTCQSRHDYTREHKEYYTRQGGITIKKNMPDAFRTEPANNVITVEDKKDIICCMSISWFVAFLFSYVFCMTFFWTDYSEGFRDCNWETDASVVSKGADSKYDGVCHVLLQWTYDAHDYRRDYKLSPIDPFYDEACKNTSRSDERGRYILGCGRSRSPEYLFWGDGIRSVTPVKRVRYMFRKAMMATFGIPVITVVGFVILCIMHGKCDQNGDYNRVDSHDHDSV